MRVHGERCACESILKTHGLCCHYYCAKWSNGGGITQISKVLFEMYGASRILSTLKPSDLDFCDRAGSQLADTALATASLRRDPF